VRSAVEDAAEGVTIRDVEVLIIEDYLIPDATHRVPEVLIDVFIVGITFIVVQ
jgi:hypothetical protein